MEIIEINCWWYCCRCF